MINKCLFPAAGYGTRFLPATKAVPKEMLPILTKPLLQYGVEEALSAGITNMAIVTGRGKRSIEDHFDHAFELEHQLKGTSSEHYLKEIKEVLDRRKPSLSASSIATNPHSGISSPSLRRFIPIKISIVPDLRLLIIFILSNV